MEINFAINKPADTQRVKTVIIKNREKDMCVWIFYPEDSLLLR